MKRILSLVIAAVMFACLTGLAFAADPAPAGGNKTAASRPHRLHVLGFVFRHLGLTDAQQTQVRDILKAARADAVKAADPAAKKAVWKAALDKIKADVLTDAQRAKLVRMHRMHGVVKGLDLTADQKAQVREILKTARADAAKAGTPEAKKAVLKAAFNKIKKDVLTDAQRQKLEQMKAKHAKPANAPAKTTT